MRESLAILNKVLLKEFYRLNTGFFLLVLGFAFGFMGGAEHRALAEFFIASPIILLIPVGVWLIYLIKIINFNRQQLSLSQNLFLSNISLLSPGQQFFSIFIIMISQFSPATFYGLFLVIIALKHFTFVPIVEIVLLQLGFIFIGSMILMRQLNHPADEKKITLLKRFFDYQFTRSLIQFYLEWLSRKQPTLLIGTKFFTGLLLFGVCQLYKGEVYDVRLLAMGTTVAFSGNFMLITILHHFENSDFALLRNLPIRMSKRFLRFLIILLILALPEIIILIRNFPSNLTPEHGLFVLLFGLSIGMIFYAMHFLNSLQEKDFSRWIFILVIGWILLILFSIPLLILSAFNFGIAIWLFTSHFYSFEQNTSKET